MRTIQSDMTKYCMTFFPRTHALSGDDQVSVGIAVNRVVLVVEPFQGHDIFFMVVGHLNLTMFSTIHLPFISVSCTLGFELNYFTHLLWCWFRNLLNRDRSSDNHSYGMSVWQNAKAVTIEKFKGKTILNRSAYIKPLAHLY